MQCRHLTDWMQVSGQLHSPAALPSGKRTRYSLYVRLREPESPSGRCEEVKALSLQGIEPDRPDCTPSLYRVALTAELLTSS
jgi:hypothetical protein